ncbi:MAG: hypothetical protein HKN95_10780 [Acidimicrobiia bacterium]|nr:hypothetical protein [Acidimicrobiia bacterium]
MGPGFHRVVAGSAALIGAGALAFDSGSGAVVGLVLLGASLFAINRPVVLAATFAVAAVGFFVAALSAGAGWPTLTGAVTLGAVSNEMLLGHWYLVDPRLPRWALKSLDGAALVGLIADFGILAGRGALTWGTDAFVVGWAFVALSILSALLITAVWFALREPGYNGVMSATGLSYLAIITVLGTTISGRSLTVVEGSTLLSG